ncbi:hypothetical protein DXG03_003012 [Asterophora parasitica]|uniref:BTB domain-containing protein n=1 Tax=Asterophora parasitica TaxID=117018 RepID=A0A9P7K8F0_9AGAR|nr:hypothetical protein DXG03_003012 [Asterophora parasitica]
MDEPDEYKWPLPADIGRTREAIGWKMVKPVSLYQSLVPNVLETPTPVVPILSVDTLRETPLLCVFVAPYPVLKFNSGDADVVFLSSDNVAFHIHRTYLEGNAGAFPPAEFDTQGEVVRLEESSTTLELLFQFVYPQRHPTLDDTPFEVLAPLAEAAEKYEVFAAINICLVRMKANLADHPVDLMNFASRHGYNEIYPEATPLLLDIPLDKVVDMLSTQLVVPWVSQHDI